MQYTDVLNRLQNLASPEAAAGMARFGITMAHAYGIATPELRQIAREIGRNHVLAQQLWSSGIHEARILASMIDDPAMVTEEQMEDWVKDFDSWDVVDQCCANLFAKTRYSYAKAIECSGRSEEFVKRAGFVLMAALAVHDKKAANEQFERFLPVIKRAAVDNRNFVKKAVNWALRQIGKRNAQLNKKALETAREIQYGDSRSARWIAADAIRELTSDAVQQRLRNRDRKQVGKNGRL